MFVVAGVRILSVVKDESYNDQIMHPPLDTKEGGRVIPMCKP